MQLDAALRRSAPIFAALGDVTRLLLVSRLAAGKPLSITRLTEGGTVTRQAITKHLRVLEAAGLARASRTGREQLWELDPRQFEEARRSLDRIGREWDAALLRLKQSLEESS